MDENAGNERNDGARTNIAVSGTNIGIRQHKKSASMLNQTHMTEAGPRQSSISIRNSPKMSEGKMSGAGQSTTQIIQFNTD